MNANPSKSHAQRAIAIASLARGTSHLTNIGSSDDVSSALGIAEALGARVDKSEESVKITGTQGILSHTWDCGESGLCLRMFSAIAGLLDTEITLTAKGSLTSRPVDFMKAPFEQLGVAFESNNGFAPITIKGPYRRWRAVVDGSVSSQFLTGLLIALPMATDDAILHVKDLKSKPYIDLTLATMQAFGVAVLHGDYDVFRILSRQSYMAIPMEIEGDWSGMAFLLVGAAIAGEVTILRLSNPEFQPDGKIAEVLNTCGAYVELSDESVHVRKGSLMGFAFDCTQYTDLFPPLVALATSCEGITKLNGLNRLKTKESDRGETLIEEFSKLGISIWMEEDTLCIEGGTIKGGIVDTHNDHRIAMALAIAALKAEGPIVIEGAECVGKSYPRFFDDLTTVGVVVNL